jgi:hypothetical protein
MRQPLRFATWSKTHRADAALALEMPQNSLARRMLQPGPVPSALPGPNVGANAVNIQVRFHGLPQESEIEAYARKRLGSAVVTCLPSWDHPILETWPWGAVSFSQV